LFFFPQITTMENSAVLFWCASIILLLAAILAVWNIVWDVSSYNSNNTGALRDGTHWTFLLAMGLFAVSSFVFDSEARGVPLTGAVTTNTTTTTTSASQESPPAYTATGGYGYGYRRI
jgi:hypothetical protein